MIQVEGGGGRRHVKAEPDVHQDLTNSQEVQQSRSHKWYDC
jgi:hypothetical protein